MAGIAEDAGAAVEAEHSLLAIGSCDIRDDECRVCRSSAEPRYGCKQYMA
jgi:hypothetical protein